MSARRSWPLFVLVSLLSVGPGVADVASAAPGDNRALSFTHVGAAPFVVPDGVTCATFDLIGARGGTASAGPDEPPVAGGLGGRTEATLQVTPGETLQLDIGGVGGDGGAPSLAGEAGVNGGAAGGP